MKLRNLPLFVLTLAALSESLQGDSVVQWSTASYVVPENGGKVTVIVDRLQDSQTVVTIDYVTVRLTATPGADYIDRGGTLVFGAGETNKIITVPIVNDALVEGSEAFQIELKNPTGRTRLGTRTTATVSISDNDNGLEFELANYYVNEDVGSVAIRVVRRDDGEFPVSFEYATANGTAVAGEDYVETAGTVKFEHGGVPKWIVIPVVNNVTREPTETFRIDLRKASAEGVLGANRSASITITDTDEVVEFQAGSLTVLEGSAFARITVTRGESQFPGSVTVTVTDGTGIAGQDYVAMTETLRFALSERMKVVDIPLLNDGLRESPETFTVVLREPIEASILGGKRTATITILDNEPGAGFENASYSVWENEPVLHVNVIRGSDDLVGPFAVGYETVDGTARAGVDYRAAAGTLTFGATETVKSVPIVLLQDPAPEDAKSLTVKLTEITGRISGSRTTAAITIVDGSHGNVEWVQPPLMGGIRWDGSLLELFWRGSRMLSRADSIVGPSARLGVLDSPLFLEPRLGAAFYQFRSPRSARIYVPSGSDGKTPLPLVLVLHGYNGSAASYLDYFQFEPLAEERGFLVCHPEGTLDRLGSRFWNATDACCNFYGSDVDDSAYLRGLIEEIAREYPVDRKRIHVVGHSNGGFMSYRMALDHGDLIAGIASLAGVTFLDPDTAHPKIPVNILQIHGTADEVVPYVGGALTGDLPVTALFPGAWATIQTWADFNGCRGRISEDQPSMDFDWDVPGLDTTVMRYTNCPPGGEVELWTIHGGKHTPRLVSGGKSSEHSARVIDWLLAHPKP